MTDTHRAATPQLTVSIVLIFTLGLSLLGGCSGLAARSRVDQFSRIAKAYEWAIESMDYRGASKYLNPSIARPPLNLQRYANVKVSQYTITHTNVSEDQRSIQLDVELQYYFLDQRIVKTTMDHQTWQYSESEKEWMLQTGLPDFPR